jgi:hypothetical protein
LDIGAAGFSPRLFMRRTWLVTAGQANDRKLDGWLDETTASPEKIAPDTVASKAPPAPSVDPAQVQQIAQTLVALRETVEQIAAGQDQTSREIARLESTVAELILKIPEPSAKPTAAPERKPVQVPPSSRAPTAPTPRH